MLRFDILNNQWLILALGGGLGLVLAGVLTYLALWRPRPPMGVSPSAEHQARTSSLRAIPMILWVTYAWVIVLWVVFPHLAHLSPPNW